LLLKYVQSIVPYDFYLIKNKSENRDTNIIRIRAVNSQSGVTIVPDKIEINGRNKKEINFEYTNNHLDDNGYIEILLPNGTFDITVSAKGYIEMHSYFTFDKDSIKIDFNLDPLIAIEELKSENIQLLHQDDAMLLYGFVVDDLSGVPLENVRIYTKDSIYNTYTNLEGYFQLSIKLPKQHQVSERNNLLFSKSEYISENINNFDMYPLGDLGLKIRLKKGSGINLNGIISHRDPEIIVIE